MKYFEKIAKNKKNRSIDDLIAGGLAGAGTALVMNPIDIWNTKKKAISGKKGNDLKKALKELEHFKKDLFESGVYKGIKTGLQGYGSKALKVGGSTAVSFYLYNKIKDNL